jgi:hypothetical protein
MKSLMLAAAICVAFAGRSALALTGTELYQSCQDKTPGVGFTACLSYSRGVMEGLLIGKILSKKGPLPYCPPDDGLSATQARLIIEKYLKDHPEMLHKQAAFLAAEALMAAFPCPGNSSQ